MLKPFASGPCRAANDSKSWVDDHVGSILEQPPEQAW